MKLEMVLALAATIFLTIAEICGAVYLAEAPEAGGISPVIQTIPSGYTGTGSTSILYEAPETGGIVPQTYISFSSTI